MADLMVVREADPRLVKRVQDGFGEDQLCVITPEAAVVLQVESKPRRDLGEHVEPVSVAQIAGCDFGVEIPAVERREPEQVAAHVQSHVADGWNRVPTQVEIFDPGVIGVPDQHLGVAAIVWQRKQAWSVQVSGVWITSGRASKASPEGCHPNCISLAVSAFWAGSPICRPLLLR